MKLIEMDVVVEERSARTQNATSMLELRVLLFSFIGWYYNSIIKMCPRRKA